MSIEKVNLPGYNPVSQGSIQNKKPVTIQKTEVFAEQDKKKSDAAKWMIGATALAGVVALVVAGRNGHLGENVQKLLRGSADSVASAAKNEASKTERIVSKIENKSLKTSEQSNNISKGGSYADIDVPEANKGMYDQDIYDPLNPLNEDDILSPYYKRKGMYGQDIYDPFDPLNKQDITSPYYEM